MTRRLARVVSVSIALAALVAGGAACSRKSAPEAAGANRPLSAIWPEVLAQRDIMHEIMLKPLEDVTHEDCAKVGAASRQLGALVKELTITVSLDKTLTEGRLRMLGDLLNRLDLAITKVRESALDEAPGLWVKLRFPLDQTLHDLESMFSAADLGGQSVVTRPGYETQPAPEGVSPI
ncbi:MAG TPA: hypothetical protein VMR31_10635 [Myxococcota bacterium]|nr:hypothetical protein [Myxococcota bacterium]